MSSGTEGTSPEHEPEAFQSAENPASVAPHDSDGEKLHLDELHFKQDGVQADAALTDDGRLNITIDGDQRNLHRLFKPILGDEKEDTLSHHFVPQSTLVPSFVFPTKLNIVIHVIGSRGDVQPFIALGKVLQSHGHRIRLATHPTFREFVEDNGLEFFSIGGDPAELMAFMVKNPGLLPGFESLRAGDVGKRRKEMAEIINGCWRSCIDPAENMENKSIEDSQASTVPFIADAIIANPPSFAHIHCAEKLRIPLHVMFTMPWSPTRAFPHPLVNTQASKTDPQIVNYLSYALVETMTWQGLGDLVNSFRLKKLGLSEIDPTFAPGMVSRLKIPHTYAWSPSLIPKPEDWGSHISISGFFFLSLASAYKPPDDLAAFLAAGPPPIYIGFGSIVVDNPDALTALILEAVEKSGVRALVSKGWGGLGNNNMHIPENVFMLGNCPHDWLFQRVSCVVHHGGAGTMAAGIAAGKPTVIVPFFGDQPFWGDMICRAGAGPAQIPNKKLTAVNLAAAITEALQPGMTHRAIELGSLMKHEKGTETAALAFYHQLPLTKMHCLLSPSNIAVWRLTKTNIRLSAMAAALLCKENLLDFDDLKLYGPCDHRTDYGSSDPLSAAVKVSYRMLSDIVYGFTEISRGVYGSYRSRGTKHGDHSTASSELGDFSGVDTASDGDDDKRPDAKDLQPGGSAVSHEKLTKKGLWRLGAVPFKTATEFTTSVAQGLHNAPKLYGDKTVRQQEKITGWQSGLMAAGKELGLGVYDGFTGVVTQPIQGYKEEGKTGLYKGIGKGLGGLLLKPIAGTSGFFGFTFSGIYKEVQKKYGMSVDGYLRATRMAQGYQECEKASQEKCEEILRRWEDVRVREGEKKGKVKRNSKIQSKSKEMKE